MTGYTLIRIWDGSLSKMCKLRGRNVKAFRFRVSMVYFNTPLVKQVKVMKPKHGK